MTISSQALSGDELARFLQLQLQHQIDGTEDEFNKELANAVKTAIANSSEKDPIKRAIALELKRKFPQISSI